MPDHFPRGRQPPVQVYLLVTNMSRDPISPMATGSLSGQNRRLLTLKEAAVVLGTSAATIRRLVSAGKLPVVRLTRRLQIDARDLERLIEQAKDRSGW